jgi:hypothetical protein
MTYRINGLDPSPFGPLYGLSQGELERRGGVRMRVTDCPGFPCRIRLEDAAIGEMVLVVNHVSHDVDNPYRASHAIFVTEGADTAAEFLDEVPPALGRRVLSLRAFDARGMMSDALLAQPGEVPIRRLFEAPQTACIHANNAVRACFAARVDRS